MKEHRKLAAIMFTDIVGYTAIMAKSEHKALGILHRHRDILKPLIGEFNGEWLKEMGDGTLSSFGSVVDAVNCALEIQNSLRDETEFKLRIGIHIGDVVVEEGDVFGDGVNVASRIENLAEPGGICVSGRVYEDIRNKPDIEAVFLGEKKLKNVEEPVKVYALKREYISAPAIKVSDEGSIEKAPRKTFSNLIVFAIIGIIVVIGGYFLYSRFIAMEKPAPITEKKPSVAVLAFDDMTSEKNMEHIGDGMADAIINALTKIGELRVPARNSTFVFKGQYKDIREIGNILDVDAVLEGSIQQYGDRVRIIAQLIRVEDDTHLWSNQYDHFVIEDVFAIQDSISFSIVEALKGKLLGEEKALIEKHPTDNTEAYNLYLKGNYYAFRFKWEKANEYFQKAVDKDPDFALAYLGLSNIYSAQGDYTKTKEAIDKALELDNTLLPESYIALAFIKFFDWDWDESKRLIESALKLIPGSVMAHFRYSNYLMIMGRINEALERCKYILDLDPSAFIVYERIIHLCLYLGKYDEAREYIDKAFAIDTNFKIILDRQRFYYALLGNYTQALKVDEKRRELDGKKEPSWWTAYIYASAGKRDKAE